MFTEFIKSIKTPRWLVSGEDTISGGLALGPVYTITTPRLIVGLTISLSSVITLLIIEYLVFKINHYSLWNKQHKRINNNVFHIVVFDWAYLFCVLSHRYALWPVAVSPNIRVTYRLLYTMRHIFYIHTNFSNNPGKAKKNMIEKNVLPLFFATYHKTFSLSIITISENAM